MSESASSSSSTCENRRVLIPVDKSQHSERAVKWFLENVKHPKDHVILFHAVELPAMPVMAMGAPAAFKVEEWKHMIREELIVVDSLKQKFEKLIQGQGVSAEFHVSDYSSSVGENVCKAAKEKSASMIVIGSRGMGKIRRTFLGSVSDFVLHHVHIPVLVVPPEHSE
ncbi:universal stress protein Slr1101-like isoform X2 [Convolutriloba macropyga]|uniref:universal stress protein Slr1101-like isoform X2 n=1 Tax=Convolutriloba macropyga TaxID=536237 RepID=UPI003F51B975